MVVRINRLYRFEGFELDPVNRILQASGETIALHSRTFDLLLYIVGNPGRLLAKEELINAVWGETAVEESNLTQGVFLLRKAFAAHHPEGGKLIVTVPGRGYRFVAEVEEVAADRSALAREVRELPEVTLPPPAPRGRLLWGAIAASVILAALLGWFWYNRSVPGDHHEIVLADFENVTGDSGFDKALKIALAIDLKQSPWLDIAPEAKTRGALKLMERAPEEKLTPALAREVCQRLNAQAVVSGLIARFGARYLVTLTASDCAGRDLVQTKAEAKSRDEVPGAIDSVSAQVRRRLGEPLNSLGRFNKPLLAKTTGSLDALKAYSAAHDLGSQGRFQESLPLFQRATELDPRFAIAYGDLGTVYSNLGEPGLSAVASRKAYELRDLTDERDRFYITSSYHSHVTGDFHAAIRNDETWAEIYPQDPAPLTSLSNLRIQIGQPEAAIRPAKKALAMDPGNAVPYINLARSQLYAGRVDEAVATCRQAIALKADRAEIHGILVFAGFAKHDEAMIEAQSAWAKGTSSEPFISLQRMLVAFAEGRPHRGEELLNRVIEGYKQRGMSERAVRMRGGLPRLEAELGMTDSARKILVDLPPIDGSTDVPVALAETGDEAKAESILRAELATQPENTLWQYWNGPQIAAAIALARHKPLDAVEALRKSIPYEPRDTEVRSLRGRAFLAAKHFDQAEAEFRKVIDQPTAGVASSNVALAHLGIARARAGKGDLSGSRSEYEKFFDVWKDAEPDVPVLREARSEYARLPLLPAH